MIAGAIALVVYSFVTCQILARAGLQAVPATLLSVVWRIVAFRALTPAGGRHDAVPLFAVISQRRPLV